MQRHTGFYEILQKKLFQDYLPGPVCNGHLCWLCHIYLRCGGENHAAVFPCQCYLSGSGGDRSLDIFSYANTDKTMVVMMVMTPD